MESIIEKLTWISFLSGVRLTKIDAGIFYLIQKWVKNDSFACLDKFAYMKKSKLWSLIKDDIEAHYNRLIKLEDKFEEEIQKRKEKLDPNEIITLGRFQTYISVMDYTLKYDSFFIFKECNLAIGTAYTAPDDDWAPFGIRKHRDWIDGKDCNDSSDFFIGLAHSILKNKDTEKFLKVVHFLIYYHVDTNNIFAKFMNFILGKYKLVYVLPRYYRDIDTETPFKIFCHSPEYFARETKTEELFDKLFDVYYFSDFFLTRLVDVMLQQHKWFHKPIPKEPVEKEPVEKEPAVVDAGKLDAGKLDAGKLDAGKLDAGKLDAGKLEVLNLLLQGETFKKIEEITKHNNSYILRASKKAQELGLIKNIGSKTKPIWVKGENYV
jgi:hypothetical protein